MPHLYPYLLGWDGLEIVPDLSDLREESGLVAKRMSMDLPDDEGATGKGLHIVGQLILICCADTLLNMLIIQG